MSETWMPRDAEIERPIVLAMLRQCFTGNAERPDVIVSDALAAIKRLIRESVMRRDREWEEIDRAVTAEDARETSQLRLVAWHAATVMDMLAQHGGTIAEHLLDDDDNPGEYLRRALKELERGE